jgi:hypothetical protein
VRKGKVGWLRALCLHHIFFGSVLFKFGLCIWKDLKLVEFQIEGPYKNGRSKKEKKKNLPMLCFAIIWIFKDLLISICGKKSS